MYTSAISFLFYEDFAYGTSFMEEVLDLKLVADEGFAKVYRVNDKAFVGIVQNRNTDAVSGNTLVSLTTENVTAEYERIKTFKLEDMTELKVIESIPLQSFFFRDKEGHRFEVQEFLNEVDRSLF